MIIATHLALLLSVTLPEKLKKTCHIWHKNSICHLLWIIFDPTPKVSENK